MKNRTYLAIFLGFAVRMLLMPLTLHGDLFFTNYFPYFLSHKGVWDIYGYFGGHYMARSGTAYYAPLVYYITAFFQWAIKLIYPGSGFSEFMQHFHSIFYERAPQGIAEYLSPYTHREIFKLIFLMKLPYLFFDGFCLWLVIKIFTDKNLKEKAVFLWCFSPLILFSVYIFGTYRIYTIFLLFGVIYLLRREKKAAAALCYGLLLLIDSFPFFLLAPSVLILESDWGKRFKLFLLMLLPFLAVFIPLYLSSHGYVVYAYASPRFNAALTQSLTSGFAPKQISLIAKITFLGFYLWMLTSLWNSKKGASWSEAVRTNLFISVNAWVMLVFYATNQTLVQYFLWVLPLFFILQVEGEPWNPLWTWALIAALFFFNLDSRALNLGLFLPLNAGAMNYPSLHEWAAPFCPWWGKAVAAARWGFSGLCLYFALRLYRLKVAPLLR